MSLWSTDPNHYPPKPLLVLLQRVTPIDHFPLSFLCLRRIDPLAVAIKQQNSGLQCHALSFPKEYCSRKFNGLLIHACEGRHLPLGKLFPQFCEGKSVVDQPTLCCEDGCAQESAVFDRSLLAMSDLAAPGM
ncbi:hypothetical protein ACWTU6_18260 [Mesorhizobium sp. BHbsci]